MQKVNLKSITLLTKGLIQIKPKLKVTSSYLLSLVYTPGVGQNCLQIRDHPDALYDYTTASNAVALITDGSGVTHHHQNELIPRLESEAALHKLFYNIDSFPFVLDSALCITEDDLLMAIENLATTYKVISLRYFNEQKIQALLPKLREKKLQATILYSSLWSAYVVKGEAQPKELLKVMIAEAAMIRAILDRRCYLPVGEGPLQNLVDHTWKTARVSLESLPTEITSSLMSVYQSALEFVSDSKLAHHTVAGVDTQVLITRMVNFYIFGKTSFIKAWGDNHLLHKHTLQENSLMLHKRYGGMISVAPKFKPRSLEDAYDLFKRSCIFINVDNVDGDIKELEDEIRKNPEYADEVTIKHNLLAIMTNGTAILGYGDIGPAAGLPVMEGKSVLFKTLAGIDVIPICIKEKDPLKAVLVMRMLAPIFSAINLEDIKAPECFEIEKMMIEQTNIPVMHDDQHGTSVVVLAAILNGLKLMKKQPNEVKLVINGAGAAGLSICELLVSLGITDIIICDTEGAIYEGRPKNMNNFKNKLALITNRQKVEGKLEDVLKGTDIFIGVSVGVYFRGALKPEMVKSMNKGCFILALANPDPEIYPDVAKEAGAFIIATGRSDFPNQVNNSLAFPGIFRGAMETKSSVINNEMKLAAAHAISNLVKEKELNPDYILPGALNADVPAAVARAVAEAAFKTGVARKTDITPDQIQDNTRKLIIEGLIPMI